MGNCQLFTFMLVGIIAMIAYQWMLSGPVHINNFSPDVEYDYIIVGAGTAGCVLANRLTEDPNITVLLLEAGPVDSDYGLSIPLLQAEYFMSTLSWGYKTAPQKEGFLLSKNQEVYWPSGKVMGGTSSINGMFYARGSLADYDNWAKMGADGWKYDEILPYFLKSENSLLNEGNKYHSTGGPLTVIYPSYIPELDKDFVEVGRKLGYRVGDYNAESPFGFSHIQVTVRNGKRVSTSKAFLHPVLNRKNLFIGTGVTVKTVIFSGNKAIGVSYVQYNIETVVKSKREVILSAGVVESPHILLLSGIGPSLQLNEAGIIIISDVPVGKNLHDHLLLPLDYILSSDDDRYDTVLHYSNILTFNTLYQYLINGGGQLSSPALRSNAYITLDSERNYSYPTLQVKFLAGVASGSKMWIELFSSNRSSLNKDILELKGYSLLLCPLHPKSVGELYLNKTHPESQPIIDPHYLEDPDDIKYLQDALKVALKIGGTLSLNRKGVKLFAEMMNSPFKFDTDEFWRWYIQNLAYSSFHYTGTCKMGSADDPSTVVDSRLRVKGVTGLRVVDASIIPESLSGNTVAAVMMIAEKAADMIKADVYEA